MKRLVVMVGFTLLAGSVAALGQSLSDVYLSGVQSIAQVQTPFGAVYGKNEPTAALQTGLQGTWWRDARWITTLDLTSDQQKKMDDAFRQNRIKLIDLTATLEKAELMLEPLVEKVQPADEAKILAQIDAVANSRAELEKANARLLLSIRETLTQDQWDKLPKNKSPFGDFFGNGKVITVRPGPVVTPEKK